MGSHALLATLALLQFLDCSDGSDEATGGAGGLELRNFTGGTGSDEFGRYISYTYSYRRSTTFSGCTTPKPTIPARPSSSASSVCAHFL